MAYLRSLVVKCRDCPRAAVEELITNRNARMGSFCRRHGARAMRELQRRESEAGERDSR